MMLDKFNHLYDLYADSNDNFSIFHYTEVDVVFGSGCGLPSCVITPSFKNSLLYTIGNDSAVVYNHVLLSKLIHRLVIKFGVSWLSSIYNSLPRCLSQTLFLNGNSYPITGCQSLLLALHSLLSFGEVKNTWTISRSSNDFFLLSHLGQPSYPLTKIERCHLLTPYSGSAMSVIPCGFYVKPLKNNISREANNPLRNFGEIDMSRAWYDYVFSYFTYNKEGSDILDKLLIHKDLFSLLLSFSVGLNKNVLIDVLDVLSFGNLNQKEIARLIFYFCRLVDEATSMMLDFGYNDLPASIYFGEINPDLRGVINER